MDKIKVVIIDDEPLARERIQDLLELEENIAVVGVASNGADAIEVMQKNQPDLVFLDIQMPEMNGFEMLEVLDVDRLPQIIFVTAYDHYALKAFDVYAMDYLLKPFDQDRFHEAVQRARNSVRIRKDREFFQKLKRMISEIKSEKQYLDRLIIKSLGRFYFVKCADIDWIEASGNYVTLHTGNKKHLMRETLSKLESKLSPFHFVRIHRSKIVNIEKIKEIITMQKGESVILLYNGTRLTLSRKYKDRLKDFV